MFQPPVQVMPKLQVLPAAMQLFSVVKPVEVKLQVQLEAVWVKVPMLEPPSEQYNKPPPNDVSEQLLKLKVQEVTC